MKPTNLRIKMYHTAICKANLAVCAIVIFFIFGWLFSNRMFDALAEMNGARSEQLVSYKISAGDTLWMIAGKSVTRSEDVRDKIIAIQKLNKISASQALIPGQIIQIPLTQSVEDGKYTFNLR